MNVYEWNSTNICSTARMRKRSLFVLYSMYKHERFKFLNKFKKKKH